MDYSDIVSECVPKNLRALKVEVNSNEDCQQLVEAVKVYVEQLLGDTEEHIEANIQKAKIRDQQRRKNKYLKGVNRVIFIYCKIYVEKMSARVMADANGYFGCDSRLHDPEMMTAAWDSAYLELTGQGRKKPHGGRKKKHYFGFPFRRAV